MAGRCTVVLVALLRCTVGVAVSTPLAGAGVAGVLACCDLVALVRCAGVVRGVVSAGVESPGCVGGCAADFLAAVVVLLVRGAERVRGAVSDGAAKRQQKWYWQYPLRSGLEQLLLRWPRLQWRMWMLYGAWQRV